MTLEELKKLANERKPNSTIQVSAADLRLLVQSNPDHPSSAVYLKAVKVRPDEYPVNVVREDVLSILENRQVVSERADQELPDGSVVNVIVKKLGKTLGSPSGDDD